MLRDINAGRLVKKISKGLEWHKNISTALLIGFGSFNKQTSRTYLHPMPYEKDHQGAFPSSSWVPGRARHTPPSWCHSVHMVCGQQDWTLFTNQPGWETVLWEEQLDYWRILFFPALSSWAVERVFIFAGTRSFYSPPKAHGKPRFCFPKVPTGEPVGW